MHLRKSLYGLVFWLLLPIIATCSILLIVSSFQSDTKIPIGIVLEEETPLALELYEAIRNAPLVRAELLTEPVARKQLMAHQIDSVFIVNEGYEANIKNDNRHRLIKGLRSDLSFAYTPTSEVVMSYVQEQAVRSKAAIEVNKLINQYNSGLTYTWEEIITESMNIQAGQDFLSTSFVYSDMNGEQDESERSFLQPWNVWSIFAFLSTLLVFDWVIKEKSSNIKARFAFIRFTFKTYLLLNLIVYSFLLYLIDCLTAGLFYFYLDEPINLAFFGVLLSNRLTLNMIGFLLALCFKNSHLFYTVAFTITLIITIISGVVIPIEAMADTFGWLQFMNPLHAFITQKPFSIWLLFGGIMLTLWFIRKERSYA